MDEFEFYLEMPNRLVGEEECLDFSAVDVSVFIERVEGIYGPGFYFRSLDLGLMILGSITSNMSWLKL